VATGKITKRSVDALAPAKRDVFLWDEELRGFGLKVTPGGAKSYIAQYRLGGREAKTRRYTIGGHGSPWTPTTARDEAERILRLVAQGVDPAEDRERRRREANDLAFRGYAARFLEEYVRHEWKASYGFAESILRLHVVPILKDRPLPLLKRGDVSAVLDAIPPGKTALRRNVYAVVRRLFRWAVGRGDIETNPLEAFEAPAGAAARDRVLKDEELRLAWLAAGNLGYPFSGFYRLLIGTGQRREEVAGLDWRELDRAAAEWSLPAARAKNGIASSIPLSAAMVLELDTIADGEKWPPRGLILSTTGKTPVSGYSRAKARLDREMLRLSREEAGEEAEAVELSPWRVHDFRRTLATGLQRLGVRFEVTEAILNHVSGSRSGVAGVYQRHDWRDEKRAALNAWAAHLATVLEPSSETNVVSIKREAPRH
jgi:integrase